VIEEGPEGTHLAHHFIEEDIFAGNLGSANGWVGLYFDGFDRGRGNIAKGKWGVKLEVSIFPGIT
jgi:hypothetical protein